MERCLQSRGRCCEDGLEVLQGLLCSVKQGSRFQRPFMDPERKKFLPALNLARRHVELVQGAYSHELQEEPSNVAPGAALGLFVR